MHYNLGSNSGINSSHWCLNNEKIDQKTVCVSWCYQQRPSLYFRGKQWKSMASVFSQPVSAENRLVDFGIQFMKEMGREINEVKLLVIARNVDGTRISSIIFKPRIWISWPSSSIFSLLMWMFLVTKKFIFPGIEPNFQIMKLVTLFLYFGNGKTQRKRRTR